MKLKKLGQTDIWLSPIGLGTVKFGRNQGVKYPTAFVLPDDKTIIELLRCAQQLGINFLDTAPAYGLSEERIGNLLKNQRKEWVIATKWGEEFVDGVSHFNFSAEHARRSIERSLRRLQTDWLDMVLVHSDGNDLALIENGVFDVLERCKQAGIIRAFGMSTKTIDGGMRAVDLSDVVMVTYNPLEKKELPVMHYAQQQNKGVLIKKALASGHVDKIMGDDPVQAAMQCIFQEASVTSVILGTLNQQHLAHNVACAQRVLDSR